MTFSAGQCIIKHIRIGCCVRQELAEVFDIAAFLEKVRKKENEVPLKKQAVHTAAVMLFGAVLGVVQKWIDGSAVDDLPYLIQKLGIGGYFGRLAIWILLAAVISVYSSSPLRASVNTFAFFISMLAGYYVYCSLILGFLPVSYMMIWVAISFASIFLANICWYAKGNGVTAYIISCVIIGTLFAQAFSLTQGFYVYHFMEIITWLAGIIVLFRKTKWYAVTVGASFAFAFVYQLIIPYWG